MQAKSCVLAQDFYFFGFRLFVYPEKKRAGTCLLIYRTTSQHAFSHFIELGNFGVYNVP
jgi:hypothetical protein